MALLSEQTKKMTEEERLAQQEKVAKMTEEELEQFRNSFDPDKMGFFGEEGEPEAEGYPEANAAEVTEEDNTNGNGSN